MSTFGKELIDSVHEAIAIAKGTAKPARRYDVKPEAVITALRKTTATGSRRHTRPRAEAAE
jgi:hypothetical protein